MFKRFVGMIDRAEYNILTPDCHRRFSQKPAPELITSFKQAFPKLADNRRDSLLATPEGKPLNTGLMSFDPKYVPIRY